MSVSGLTLLGVGLYVIQVSVRCGRERHCISLVGVLGARQTISQVYNAKSQVYNAKKIYNVKNKYRGNECQLIQSQR